MKRGLDLAMGQNCEPLGSQPHSRDWVSARWLTHPLPWIALTCLAIVAAGWPHALPLYADSVAYRALALGHYDQVPGSIAGRMLHPALVRLVSSRLDIDIDRAFFVVAIGSLLVLSSGVVALFSRSVKPAMFALPLLFTPVIVHDMFKLYYCQDLFYAALLSIGFILLSFGCRAAAIVLLLPLYLTRESTVLLCLAWAGIAWYEVDLTDVAACGAVSVGGLWLSRRFAAAALPNIHHTNELAFLALKPPFDLLRTLLGVILVPTEMRGRPGFTCTQVANFHLPGLLAYGSTTQVGMCWPEWRIPLHTMVLWLSLFGIGPAVMGTLLWRGKRRLLGPDVPRWIKLALIYGLAAYFIAPAVSFWLERDIGYAWPAFWIAVPYLLPRYCALSPAVITFLIAQHLAASWFPYWLMRSPVEGSLLAALLVALGLQVLAWQTLLKTKNPCAVQSEPPESVTSEWA